jgi:hypothetical protein
MRYGFKTLREFLRARDKNPSKYARFDMSPGGAASFLGVSRQRIHQLTFTPYLDACVTDDGFVLLDYAQVMQRRRIQVKEARARVDGVQATA